MASFYQWIKIYLLANFVTNGLYRSIFIALGKQQRYVYFMKLQIQSHLFGVSKLSLPQTHTLNITLQCKVLELS